MALYKTDLYLLYIWLQDKSFISPYDNFGDKKVGKDIEGPVFMFVPKSDQPQNPRVGER